MALCGTLQQRKALKVAFRVDASLAIGTGHVMRCLTLADTLYKKNVKSTFICRQHTSNLVNLVLQRGYKVILLPKLENTQPSGNGYSGWLGTDMTTDARDCREMLKDDIMDLLVVDHYALDSCWESAMRSNFKHLMVIDDLADRDHDCDLLLDQNLGHTDFDYQNLVSKNCIKLVGPKYALLRPDFAKERERSVVRRIAPQLKNILIFMGGMDKDNMTQRVLDALQACILPHDASITVVMGQNAPWLHMVRDQVKTMNPPAEVLVGVDRMASIMANSDLAIGGAGSASWERCCLGLPSIQIIMADNQKQAGAAISSAGAALTIFPSSNLASDIQKCIQKIQTNTKILSTLSESALKICDGKGSSRVTNFLFKNAFFG